MSSRTLDRRLRHPPRSPSCRSDGEDMAPTKRAMLGDVASSREARSPQRLGVLLIEVGGGPTAPGAGPNHRHGV
jgi:hypothetical protein